MATVPRNDYVWLTTAEVAALLRVSVATVRANAAQLGGLRAGRQWRFPTPVAAPTMNTAVRRGHPTRERVR